MYYFLYIWDNLTIETRVNFCIFYIHPELRYLWIAKVMDAITVLQSQHSQAGQHGKDGEHGFHFQHEHSQARQYGHFIRSRDIFHNMKLQHFRSLEVFLCRTPRLIARDGGLDGQVGVCHHLVLGHLHVQPMCQRG